MSKKTNRPRKFFTVEQANAALPLVRAIAADMSSLAREISERRQRIDHLAGDRNVSENSRDPYVDELVQVREELQKDVERLNGYLGELRELGVEPKGLEDGLVDFPSLMDGKQVCLCWKLDEPEVMYWHDLDAGFGGRQPLIAGSVAGEQSDNLSL